MPVDLSYGRSEPGGSDRSDPKWLAWFFVALAILLAWHLYHGANGAHWARPPLSHGDGPDYESIAYSLSEGKGFQFAWDSEDWQRLYREDPDASTYTQLERRDWPGPTASRPPLYPFVVASIYSLIPRGPAAFAAVRLLSILCTAAAGALAVGMAYDLACKLSQGRWIPTMAAGGTLALALLDRTIRTYSVDFLTEPMALFWSTLIALGLMRWQRRPKGWLWFCVLVLATSALILTRSIAIFWLPGLAVLVAATATGKRLGWGGLYVALVLVLLMPWWVRNCIVLNRAMPLGGQGAASLRGGYSDEALSDWGNWNGSAEERLQRVLDAEPGSQEWTQAEREVALADRASRETWIWIANHLPQLPHLMAMRAVSHWSPFTGASLLWRLAVVAGWLGLAYSRRRELIWILGLPAISTLTVAVLYETGGRFLVPLYALLYLTAGLGIALGLERVRALSATA